MHLLVLPTTGQASISRLLARIKQPFSKEIKQFLVEHDPKLLDELTVRERPGKFCFRFWQEGPGFDRILFEPGSVEAAIQYMHFNPVKRSLCERAIDWKWSSARFYLAGTIDRDLPQLTFPPAELFLPSGVQVAH